jgi:hypothetical protein
MCLREDLEIRWVTNLREERMGFDLIAKKHNLALAPTCSRSVTTNTCSPPSWKDEDNGFLAMQFKSQRHVDERSLLIIEPLVHQHPSLTISG